MNAKSIHRPAGAAMGFTLVEIMITIAILGILLAIASSTWMKQREISRRNSCQENLAKLDQAKEQWALENNRGQGATVQMKPDLVLADGTGYLKKEPLCPSANEDPYLVGTVGEAPVCPVVATEPLHVVN